MTHVIIKRKKYTTSVKQITFTMDDCRPIMSYNECGNDTDTDSLLEKFSSVTLTEVI